MQALLVAVALVGLWLQVGRSYRICRIGQSHGEAARLVPLALRRSHRLLRAANAAETIVPPSRSLNEIGVAVCGEDSANRRKSLLGGVGKGSLAFGLFALAELGLHARPALASAKSSVAAVEPGAKLGSKNWLKALTRLFSSKDANSVVNVASVGVARMESLPASNSIGVGKYFAFFLALGTTLAYLKNARAGSRLTTELVREQKYKEMMYIEAVSEVLAKLKNPKLKNSVKANLEQQLNELDPQGKIRQYLQTGGTTMPDLSDVVKRSAPAKRARPGTEGERTSGTSAPRRSDAARKEASGMRPSPSSPESPSSTSSSPQPSEAKKVLRELDNSLRQSLPSPKRAKLIGFLEMRLMAISDLDKRSTALEKIRRKLGDNDYWVGYAENNV